jgi:hypothetical protein
MVGQRRVCVCSRQAVSRTGDAGITPLLEQSPHLARQDDSLHRIFGDRNECDVLGTSCDKGREAICNILWRASGCDAFEFLCRHLIERFET